MKKNCLRQILCALMVCVILSLTAVPAMAYEWGTVQKKEGDAGNVLFTHSGTDACDGNHFKAFDNAKGFEDILSEIDAMNCDADCNNRLEITLYQDMTVADFDIKTPHCELVLNLNGHTLSVSSSRNGSYTYESLIINGEGGTIDFQNVERSYSVFTIKECDSDNNSCGLNISNVTIKNVNAPRLFDIEEPDKSDETTWHIADSNFYDCSFRNYGGVFYINNSSLDEIMFSSVDFVNIKNTYYGGAIYINNMAGEKDDYARVDMYGCAFVECCSPYGGAIFLNEYYVFLGDDYSDEDKINVCRNCDASECGGAIYDEKGYNTIKNFRFADNSCSGYGNYGGGAVHLDSYYTSIYDCGFFFNHASNGHGGAINIYHSGSETYIENCTFTGNSAGDGHPDVYNSPPTYNCVWSTTLRLSDDSNYSGDTLVNGLTYKDPILLHNADDLAALAVNLVGDNSDTYNNRFYKLSGNIKNAYLSISNMQGEFDFDGHHVYTKLRDELFATTNLRLKSPYVKNIFEDGELYKAFSAKRFIGGDDKHSGVSSYAKETPTVFSTDERDEFTSVTIKGNNIIKSALMNYLLVDENSTLIIAKDETVSLVDTCAVRPNAKIVCCGNIDVGIYGYSMSDLSFSTTGKIQLVNCCRGSCQCINFSYWHDHYPLEYIDHYYVDGVCIGCGKVCDHSCGYEDGICKDCGTSDGNPAGFTLSGGNWWIVGGGAAVILGGAAVIVISKKKKAAA